MGGGGGYGIQPGVRSLPNGFHGFLREFTNCFSQIVSNSSASIISGY